MNALGAANALCLANPGDDGFLFGAVFSVERLGLNIQQVSQRLNGLFTAGGTLVNGVAVGDGFRIRAAAGIAALATLGLGEQGIDLFADRVAFDAKTNRRKTQQRAEHRTQTE